MSFHLSNKIDEHIVKCYGMSNNTIYEEWYYDGELHRIDGPAIITSQLCLPGDKLSSEIKKWYYNGEHIKCSSQEEFEKIIKLKVFW